MYFTSFLVQIFILIFMQPASLSTQWSFMYFNINFLLWHFLRDIIWYIEVIGVFIQKQRSKSIAETLSHEPLLSKFPHKKSTMAEEVCAHNDFHNRVCTSFCPQRSSLKHLPLLINWLIHFLKQLLQFNKSCRDSTSTKLDQNIFRNSWMRDPIYKH